MAENHPFTIKIEPHIEGSSRYRWSVYERGKLRDQSLTSYATIREAHADAIKVLQKLIAIHRIDKRSSTPSARAT
ncbi:hypothetical protein SAMN05519103_03972 [Rhizobiales bacterium GAS113]|nr:hypothetical protein SAMN05519103_03972 [Rhizobiales bacterium GAS113]